MEDSSAAKHGELVSADSVYATLVLSDDYVVGARVVAHELHRLDPTHKVVCLVARGHVSPTLVGQLDAAVDEIVFVDAIDAGDTPELRLLDRPELRLATTKIWLWALPYRRVVYLDADTLPLANLQSLFDVPLPTSRHLAAAPDCGWPDMFNSGVLVLQPDRTVVEALVAKVRSAPLIDGSDQGLFNQEFAWIRLSFLYNVTVNASYEYAPAYHRFQHDVKILHFIGPQKPWAGSRSGPSDQDVKWWAAYNSLPSSAGRSLFTTGIPAPPDYWDATTHAPFKNSRPEGEYLAQRLDNLSVEPEPEALSELDVHTFPVFGPSVVELPFERHRRRPERQF